MDSFSALGVLIGLFGFEKLFHFRVQALKLPIPLQSPWKRGCVSQYIPLCYHMYVRTIRLCLWFARNELHSVSCCQRPNINILWASGQYVHTIQMRLWFAQNELHSSRVCYPPTILKKWVLNSEYYLLFPFKWIVSNTHSLDLSDGWIVGNE